MPSLGKLGCKLKSTLKLFFDKGHIDRVGFSVSFSLNVFWNIISIAHIFTMSVSQRMHFMMSNLTSFPLAANRLNGLRFHQQKE